MFKVTVKLDIRGVRRRGEQLLREREQKIEQVFHRVGALTVEYLRSYTGERRPPAHMSPSEIAATKSSLAKRQQELAEAEAKGKTDRARQLRTWIQAHERKLASLDERERPAHPGHWADRSKKLMEGYSYSVGRTGDGWQLTIRNTAPHAHLMERKGEFFVVSGVAQPGGPVNRALRRAVREIAPEWMVT